MKEIIKSIEKLKEKEINHLITKRISEFENVGKSSPEDIFNELCFCLLTANFSAKGGIKIQEEIGEGFLHLSQEELSKKLSELGHRFPNVRAKFIFEARQKKSQVIEILEFIEEETEKRDWLQKNVKGLGMKEASHFLRNIGYKNLAIIDFHIVDLLVKHDLIKKPKTITRKKYLEIESFLMKISEKTKIPLGELDLYLWYFETGKVLK